MTVKLLHIFSGVMLAAGVLAVSSAFCDTIHLKNGRSISGIISGETDDRVVLELGVGSTTLKKSGIRTIERSNPEQNREIEAGWQRAYSTHKKYAPHEFQDLATEYRATVELRGQAIDARSAIARLKKKEEACRKDLVRLEEDIVSVSTKLKDFGAIDADNADDYNAVVREINALHASIVVQRKEIEDTRKEVAQHNSAISGYVASLNAFEKTFLEQATHEARQKNPEFFNAIEVKLHGFETEFQRNEIVMEQRGSGLMVTAVINGRVGGTFLVDTGAGIMTISSTFADKLGLDLSDIEEVEVILADGNKARAIPFVLDSVELGDAKAEKVDVVVMQNAPGHEVDGLLGMSFLKDFVVSVDAGAGKLILRKFRPDRQ